MAEKESNKPNLDADPEPPETKELTLASLITEGIVHKPPRTFLYGVHGIGKSTFASHAPAAVFIPTEDGLGEIDCKKLPTARSSDDVLKYLRMLYAEKHSYQTVVIDSADWLENFIHLELKQEYTDKALSYGKGSVIAAEKANEILLALNHLRARRKMNTILVAHSEIKRFDSPMTEPYDRYQPKLQARFGALLMEWADAVLFTNYDVTVKKEDVGFNKEVRRGVSAGERMIYTQERPAFYAKNRYQLPPELPLNWDEFAAGVPFYKQPAQKAAA